MNVFLSDRVNVENLIKRGFALGKNDILDEFSNAKDLIESHSSEFREIGHEKMVGLFEDLFELAISNDEDTADAKFAVGLIYLKGWKDDNTNWVPSYLYSRKSKKQTASEEKGVEWLKLAAQENHAEALATLGKYYDSLKMDIADDKIYRRLEMGEIMSDEERKKGIKRNVFNEYLAASYYKKAAELKSTAGCIGLLLMYHNEEAGLRKNEKVMYRLLKTAGQKADSNRLAYIGDLYSTVLMDSFPNSKNLRKYLKEAIAAKLKAANAGDGKTISDLYYNYYIGWLGYPLNFEKAESYMYDLLRHEQWSSLGTLSLYYDFVEYVPKAGKLAFENLSEVYRQRSSYWEWYMLARLYRDGIGVEKDLKKAKEILIDQEQKIMQEYKNEFGEIIKSPSLLFRFDNFTSIADVYLGDYQTGQNAIDRKKGIELLKFGVDHYCVECTDGMIGLLLAGERGMLDASTDAEYYLERYKELNNIASGELFLSIDLNILKLLLLDDIKIINKTTIINNIIRSLSISELDLLYQRQGLITYYVRKQKWINNTMEEYDQYYGNLVDQQGEIWEWMEQNKSSDPKVQEYFGILALRNGDKDEALNWLKRSRNHYFNHW